MASPHEDLRINIPIKRGENDQSFNINNLPMTSFWDVYEAISKAGVEGATDIAFMVGWVLKDGKVLNPNETDFLIDFIEGIKRAGARWRNREEFTLSITYYALRERSISRERAARVATQILGKHYTTDAWRLKVDRWAEDVGLPKVGIRKRKK